jgi:hypothetical protein
MAETQENTGTAVAEAQTSDRYTIKHRPHYRQWEVLDPAGELVCVTVYLVGARSILRHFGKEWDEVRPGTR